MKFVIRRLAAGLGLLGITSTIGAYLNGNDPFNSAMVIGLAWFALLLTQIRD
jgi:hypothetical protein